VTEEETPPEGDEDEFDTERAKAKIAKANAEAAGLRKRLKELEAKAAKLDELEESKKTEQEKLAEQARSLEDRASKAEMDSARLRIALRKGLSEHQAKRLVGSSEEELEADADELLEAFKSDPPNPGVSRVPVLRGGGDPTQESTDSDPLLRELKEKLSL